MHGGFCGWFGLRLKTKAEHFEGPRFPFLQDFLQGPAVVDTSGVTFTKHLAAYESLQVKLFIDHAYEL